MSIFLYDVIMTVMDDMLEGRELASWVSRMDDCEESLEKSAEKQCGKVFKKLFPRAKAKALHNENLKTEIHLTVSMTLADEPVVRVKGVVPPTIIECHEY